MKATRVFSQPRESAGDDYGFLAGAVGLHG